MPYSKRQVRWANATGQPFAEQWNKKIKAMPGGYHSLPERSTRTSKRKTGSGKKRKK